MQVFQVTIDEFDRLKTDIVDEGVQRVVLDVMTRKHAKNARPRHAKAPRPLVKTRTSSWVRHESVLSLCNKCCPDTIETKLPCFKAAVLRADDYMESVSTIMNAIAASDSYVIPFCKVLRHLRGDIPRIREALDKLANDYVQSSPYDLSVAPDDYDSFCTHVKEKRRRRNVGQALLKLGYKCKICRLTEGMLRVISTIDSTKDMDVAIYILSQLVHMGETDVKKDLAKVYRKVSNRLPPRYKFSIMDALRM